MKTIAIAKFKETCLRVLEDVRRGQPVLVTKRGQPIAQVLPPPPSSRGAWRGAMRGKGRILGDVVAPAAERDDWSVLRS
jgi:prevent-host-death family protein